MAPRSKTTRSTLIIGRDSTKPESSSALGISLANAHVLRDAVLAAIVSSNDAEARGDNGFGEVFVLSFPMKTAAGSAVVQTAWIIRKGEDFPRLTTCYIL